MRIDAAASLDVAASIARHLCDTAFEYGGRHAWVGATQDADEDSGALTFACATLGPDLSRGTSGIALFLCEMWARSGDPRFRDAAEGGVRHALSRLGKVPRPVRFGFYSGHVGIAYAAARIGRLLDRADLVARASELLADLANDTEEPLRLDVLDGAAGAAPALLVLAEQMAQPRLASLAETLGDRMLGAATRQSEGLSWGEAEPADGAAPHLTGLAHGAAGFGWSLFELYAATGEKRFRDGAEEAFRWENHWFRVDRENWPDFRDFDGETAQAPCRVAWCDGAPGIGLTRLRALEIHPDAQHRRDAEAAVRTAKRALRDESLAPGSDFSPCRGLTGTGEFLLRAADVLSDDEARAMVLEAAALGAARYAHTPETWPCGVARGSTPSFMPGLAGIGYFYLRLAVPGLPSLLLLRPGPGHSG